MDNPTVSNTHNLITFNLIYINFDYHLVKTGNWWKELANWVPLPTLCLMLLYSNGLLWYYPKSLSFQKMDGLNCNC
jgi:hypothetical protein